jgi:hypothetical protein
MKCIYCGKSAGFFRRKHKECQQKYNDTIQSLPSKVGILDIAELEQYAYDGFVKPQKLRLIILNAFRLRLKCHMIDHFVTKEEEAEAETLRDR